jgi:hypothetical protein
MLVQFNNQVLAHGPSAVLPQNLNDKWLGILQEFADEFLDSNYAPDECRDPQDIADPLLTACVYELVRYQNPDKQDYSVNDMMEKLTIYALAITLETVKRETNMAVDDSTLSDILSWDRIMNFQNIKPELIDLLEKACILKHPEETNWFQKIKNKFFSKHS